LKTGLEALGDPEDLFEMMITTWKRWRRNGSSCSGCAPKFLPPTPEVCLVVALDHWRCADFLGILEENCLS